MTNTSIKVAVFGATSHIAKGLIVNFDKSGEYDLTLFARNKESVKHFLQANNCRAHTVVDDFSILHHGSFDVVLNCIVNSKTVDPLKGFNFERFETMEHYDNFILEYLFRNNHCLYVKFSSGTVYGGEYLSPAHENQVAVLPVNCMTPHEFYQAINIYSEAKHRSLMSLKIVDIRVFSYFSRFLDINSHFLLAEVISCLRSKNIFETDDTNIIRDFAHPDDLFRLIQACINNPVNQAVDLYSKAPISKFELMALFEKEFQLQCRVTPQKIVNERTGIKPVYCSQNNAASTIGYTPFFSSHETVLSETKRLLESDV